MSARRRVSTGTPWEATVGYCRALRVELGGGVAQVLVSGTAPVADDGGTFAPGDAYAQARRCFEIALGAMADLGAGAADVVRSRMFVTDIARWAEFGRAHGEVFAAHPPVTSMVEVRALIAPDMLIEVELDAIVRGPSTEPAP